MNNTDEEEIYSIMICLCEIQTERSMLLALYQIIRHSQLVRCSPSKRNKIILQNLLLLFLQYYRKKEETLISTDLDFDQKSALLSAI